MPSLLNRVKDSSTTTGTGAFTVSGTPPSGFDAYSTVPTGAVFDYTIEHDSANEWEVGRGKKTGATTFSRDQIVSSSNSGSAVNFSSGNKTVFVTVAGQSVVQRGRMFAAPYTMR